MIARPPYDQVLTVEELLRLTLWKWRYTFEALGFDAVEVGRLTFLKWLSTLGCVD